MRKEGLEPTHPLGYQILSLARLPVPPLSRPLQRTPDSARVKGPAPQGFPYVRPWSGQFDTVSSEAEL